MGKKGRFKNRSRGSKLSPYEKRREMGTNNFEKMGVREPNSRKSEEAGITLSELDNYAGISGPSTEKLILAAKNHSSSKSG